MTYDVASQLQYTNIAYRTRDGLPKGATIASGGCGPSSVRNLGNNLLGWDTTIPKIAQIAVDCGARYNGGTTISTLLKSMKAKYGGFTYGYTESDDTAFEAVKNGAMCIIHTCGAVGGTYNKLLSSSGHFMCLAAVDSSYGYIIDSCSSASKWKLYSNRRKYCKLVQSDGLVRVALPAIRATIDYYYIVKKDVKAKTPDAATNKKEDDEVVQNVKMKINGSAQTVKSILKDGRNYVQLAQIGELLGLQIGYTDKTPTVDFAQLKIKIAGTDHTVSGGAMVPGTSYAAVRELLELLGYEVGWDADAKAVTVKSGGADAGSGIVSKELGE